MLQHLLKRCQRFNKSLLLYFFGLSAVVLNDLGCSGMLWDALGCSGMLRDASAFIETLPEIQ